MSAGVNVLRYSALGFGVIYGLYHQSAITSSNKAASLKREYQQKLDLISKAKADYAKRTAPKVETVEGSNVISDPMDPNFDLEKYLTLPEKSET